MIGSPELLIILSLSLILPLFLWYVYDIVKRDDLNNKEKTLWIGVIFLFSLLGVIVYVAAKTWRYYKIGRGDLG